MPPADIREGEGCPRSILLSSSGTAMGAVAEAGGGLLVLLRAAAAGCGFGLGVDL